MEMGICIDSPSVHLSIGPSIYPFICPSVYPSVCHFLHSSIRPSVQSSLHLFVFVPSRRNAFVENKALYTAALVVDGWARAENLEKGLVTDGRTYGQTDIRTDRRTNGPKIGLYSRVSATKKSFICLCPLPVRDDVITQNNRK